MTAGFIMLAIGAAGAAVTVAGELWWYLPLNAAVMLYGHALMVRDR